MTDPVDALIEAAEYADRPAERYLLAHEAALRIAAAAMAGCPRRRGQLHTAAGGRRNGWAVLAELAPELGEWAAYFEALQLKQRAVAAGAVALVSEREADDLVRDVRAFRAAVDLGRRWREQSRRRALAEVVAS